MKTSQSPVYSTAIHALYGERSTTDIQILSIVTRRDEKVGHLRQLVLSKGLLVLTPVVLVSSLPALDTLLDGGWNKTLL